MAYNNTPFDITAGSVQVLKEGFDLVNQNFTELNGANKAALRDVQTSPTDTTEGRLMAFGAFGWGGNAGTRDADSIYDETSVVRKTSSGFYGTYGTGLNLGYAGNRNAQFFLGRIADGGLKAFIASEWDGNKIGPYELYHKANILGTVSQSGGVPTGSIIERGSNSNGEYVKFADGTIFCYVQIACISGETLASSSVPVTVISPDTLARAAASLSWAATSSQIQERANTVIEVSGNNGSVAIRTANAWTGNAVGQVEIKGRWY